MPLGGMVGDVSEYVAGIEACPLHSLGGTMSQQVEELIRQVEPHALGDGSPPPRRFAAYSEPASSHNNPALGQAGPRVPSLPRILIQSPSLPRAQRAAMMAGGQGNNASPTAPPRVASEQPDVIPFAVSSAGFRHTTKSTGGGGSVCLDAASGSISSISIGSSSSSNTSTPNPPPALPTAGQAAGAPQPLRVESKAEGAVLHTSVAVEAEEEQAAAVAAVPEQPRREGDGVEAAAPPPPPPAAAAAAGGGGGGVVAVVPPPHAPVPAGQAPEPLNRIDGWYRDRLYKEREVWQKKRRDMAAEFDRICTERADLQDRLWQAQRECDGLGRAARQAAGVAAEAETLRAENTALSQKLAGVTQDYSKALRSLEEAQELQARQRQGEEERSSRLEELEGRLRERDAASAKQLLERDRHALAEGKRADDAEKEVAEAHDFSASLEARLRDAEAGKAAAEERCRKATSRVAEVEQQLQEAAESLDAASRVSRAELESVRAEQRSGADTAARLQGAVEAERRRAQQAEAALQRAEAGAAEGRLRADTAASDHAGTVSVLRAEVAQLKAAALDSRAHQAELSRVRDQLAAAQLEAKQRELETGRTHRTEKAALQKQAADATAEAQRLAKVHEELAAQLSGSATAQEALERLSTQYLAERAGRIRLHDQLVQLRGNIRVKCRLRPPLSALESSDRADIAPGAAQGSLQVSLKNGKKRDFRFDGVVPERASQEDVFERNASDLIQSVLDGYNVCIMAYGQTGSGKTHTMFGGSTPDSRGIIARSLERFWQLLEGRAHADAKVTVSMVEIYCGEVRDLLEGLPLDAPTTRYKMGSDTVTHRLMAVRSVEECLAVMQQGLTTRAASGTLCNAQSSRSHCLYTLHYEGVEGVEGVECAVSSRMVLVDLGGSECVTKAGVEGVHVRESQHINKSLSALSDVLTSISAGRAHIPYRNSKLTHLLSSCLGGDAKMLLFVTINPAQGCAAETIHTLDFGHKARQAKRGPATRHITAVQGEAAIAEAP